MPVDIGAFTPLPVNIADALPALVACFDAQQRFCFVNRAYEEWFKLPLETVRGRPLREVLSEEVYERLAPHIAKALAGEVARFEATILNGVGAPRRIHAQYLPWRGEDGGLLGWCSVIVDRNDSDQNVHLQSMLDGIGDGFCSFDELWRLTYCNEAAERLLGIERSTALGRTYRELVPSLVGTPIEAAFQGSGASQSRLDIEIEDAAPGRVLAISLFPVGARFALSFRDVTVRNAAIRRAREQEQRLELAMAASGFGDFTWDAATDLINFSPRAAAIFGVPQGRNLTRASMLALLHDEDRERARSGLARALAERSNYEMEYRVKRPSNGEWAWVLALGRGIYDAEGHATGVVGVVGDISRSKSSEVALRESEARFRAMAEAAPAPVWVTSATGEMEFANKAFVDFSGVSREELLGDGWISLIHPDDLPSVVARRAHARSRLEAYAFEARFITADGRTKIIEASSQPWFDASGAFQGYVGLATDLTEMRQAERALRESEQRFRLVAEDAPVMLWMSDERGDCLYLNRMLREFWGAPEDLDGFDWNSRLLPEDRPHLQKVFGPAMANREPFTVEARYRRADGEVRSLLTRGRPRFDAEGAFMGMIGVNSDVTEVRRSQAHQQLLINELNHRVKNTLATVQSMAHQTLQSERLTREARNQFTDRLLALSAAHNVLTRQSWGGAPMLEIVAEAIRPYEDDQQPRVTLQGPAVRLTPSVALALSMALHELATNALKYGAFSTERGEVFLSWELEPGGEHIAVEWRETGGPPATPPSRTGFGSRLLQQGLATELGAAAVFDYAPSGLICRFRAPIQSTLSPDPLA